MVAASYDQSDEVLPVDSIAVGVVQPTSDTLACTDAAVQKVPSRIGKGAVRRDSSYNKRRGRGKTEVSSRMLTDITNQPAGTYGKRRASELEGFPNKEVALCLDKGKKAKLSATGSFATDLAGSAWQTRQSQ